MIEPKWTCAICGRKYANLATFLRHKCAREERKAIEAALDADDGTELMEIADAAEEGPGSFWAKAMGEEGDDD